jgi:hypothetical protein
MKCYIGAGGNRGTPAGEPGTRPRNFVILNQRKQLSYQKFKEYKVVEMMKIMCLITIIFVLSFDTFVYACSCDKEPSVAVEFQNAEVVFTGHVVNIKELREERYGLVYDIKRVTFNNLHNYKGVSTNSLIIEGTGETCDYYFVEGDKYLVYADEEEGKFYSDICGRTKKLSEASEELKELEKIISEAKKMGGV